MLRAATQPLDNPSFDAARLPSPLTAGRSHTMTVCPTESPVPVVRRRDAPAWIVDYMMLVRVMWAARTSVRKYDGAAEGDRAKLNEFRLCEASNSCTLVCNRPFPLLSRIGGAWSRTACSHSNDSPASASSRIATLRRWDSLHNTPQSRGA
jgi:hypothetical protein